MCIIVIKKEGQAAVTRETLEACFLSNPHGAGIAISRGNAPVRIIKGLMSFDAFYKAVTGLDIQESDTVLYHFRIATSGGVKASHTHPFPISQRKEDLLKLDITTQRAFVHNGVIGPGRDGLSDTQAYILDNLAKYRGTKRHLDQIAADTHGSRTAILARGGKLFLTGDWQEVEGYLFSNKTHLPYLDGSIWDYSFNRRAGWTRATVEKTFKDSVIHSQDCLYCFNRLEEFEGLDYCFECDAEFSNCVTCKAYTETMHGQCYTCLELYAVCDFCGKEHVNAGRHCNECADDYALTGYQEIAENNAGYIHLCHECGSTLVIMGSYDFHCQDCGLDMTTCKYCMEFAPGYGSMCAPCVDAWDAKVRAGLVAP